MAINRLPAMRVGFAEEDLCIFWEPDGVTEENAELRFNLGPAKVALDVRWQSPDRLSLVFYSEGQSLAGNQAWDNLRHLLADFWAERKEIDLVSWAPEVEEQGLFQTDCAVSLAPNYRDLAEALVLLGDLGQLLRGYLAGSNAL